MTDTRSWRTDLDLVRRSLAGDQSAVSAFTDRMVCIPRYLRALNRVHPARVDDSSLEDVAQEAMFRCWDFRDRFSGISKLESWFCGCTHNVYLEALRARKRVDRYEESIEGIDGDHLRDPVDEVTDVLGEVSLRFETLKLKRVFATLPEKDRELIRQRIEFGRTFSELGEDWNVSSNTLKARYYRALEKLGRHFEGPAGQTRK